MSSGDVRDDAELLDLQVSDGRARGTGATLSDTLTDCLFSVSGWMSGPALPWLNPDCASITTIFRTEPWWEDGCMYTLKAGNERSGSASNRSFWRVPYQSTFLCSSVRKAAGADKEEEMHK